MGADGAATLGSIQQRTVWQPVKKLSILASQIIVGSSGHVGLGQRLRFVTQQLWEAKKFSGVKPEEAVTTLRNEFWPYLEVEIHAAEAAGKIAGYNAYQSAITQTLIAMPIRHEACLFQFDQQGAPEIATRDIPFVAIGSGQGIADPFLAFIRRIFWEKDKLPKLSEGIFATQCTLKHAITTAPGGIGGDTQVMVLEKSDGNWQAKELSAPDLQEHNQNIEDAENALKHFRELYRNLEKGVTPPPSPSQ